MAHEGMKSGRIAWLEAGQRSSGARDVDAPPAKG